MKSVEGPRHSDLRIATERDVEDRDRLIEARIHAVRDAYLGSVRAIDVASETLRRHRVPESEIEFVEARLAYALRVWRDEALVTHGISLDTFLHAADED